MTLDFTGRSALVLGGGDPLSDAIAARLEQQGARVRLDTDGAKLVRDAVEEGDAIDILILAPDIADDADLFALDATQFDTVLDRQLRSAFDAVRAALSVMQARGYGRIVACAPSSALFGASQGIARSAAAAGLMALIKGVALTPLPAGILANAVSCIAETPSNRALFDHHPVLERQLFTIDVLLPAITYLAHESCLLDGEVISAGAGRFAKAITSVTLGGFDPAIKDDGFVELLPKITDTRSTFSPNTVVDELITIAV